MKLHSKFYISADKAKPQLKEANAMGDRLFNIISEADMTYLDVDRNDSKCYCVNREKVIGQLTLFLEDLRLITNINVVTLRQSAEMLLGDLIHSYSTLNHVFKEPQNAE